MKNIILGLFLTVVIAIGLLAWAIHSSRGWEWILKKSLGASLKKSGMVLKEIKVANPRPQWNENILTFDKISGWIVHQQKTYHLQLKQIKVEGLKSLFNSPTILIEVKVAEMSVDSASLNGSIQNFNLESDFERRELRDKIPFSFHMSGMKFNEYNCSALKGNGLHSHQEINIKDIQADCYEGKITAQLSWSYIDRMDFQLNMDFNDVDLKELEKINRDVFDKIHGRVAGGLMVKGDKNHTAEFQSTLKILTGGEIQATLLKQVLPYIPQSVQRKELENLIRKKGLIPVEKAVFQLNRVTDEKLASTVIVESKKMNLNTNVTLDINVEGGVKNWISMTKTILKVYTNREYDFLNKGGGNYGKE